MPPLRNRPDGFKLKNKTVDEAFYAVINDAYKNPRKKCRYCDKEMDHNTTNLQKHLDRCQAFRDGKAPQDPGGSQQTLTNLVATMPQTKAEHWNRAGMAVYMNNLPFGHYEDKYVRDHPFHINPKYLPPERKALSGHILAECYRVVYSKVEIRLRAPRWLNFYTDESDNIRRERVINFLAHAPPGCGTDGGCFYWNSEVNGAKTMDAETQLEYVLRQATIATDRRLWRMNSLATDTCATMRSLWAKIQATPQLRHVFCVPCDSHGIQLFLKDIFRIPWWKDTIKHAQLVVRSFRAAHKEYAVLQDFQLREENGGKRIALILHCITRWGTQVGMLRALRRSQAALEAYSQQTSPQIDKGRKKKTVHILPILRDPYFWQKVATATRILTPIHEIQCLSEADNYPLYRVINNWILIKQSLMKSGTEHGTQDCQIPYIVRTLWDDRYLKQVTELHVVTSLLIPGNHTIKSIGQTPETAFGPIMTRFFLQYTPGTEQTTTCMRDFWAFRAQIHAFFPHQDSVWTYIDDPVTFWDTAAQFCPTLGTLASRLLQVPGNSVPGERAWSIQNLILTKTRNGIKSVNLDRLLFIYINERILNRPVGPGNKKLPYTHGILASDEELAELEDLMLQGQAEEDPEYLEVEVGDEQDETMANTEV